ncbi:uncharacterized protein LOC143018014 [Oratosquilla oratoria]|uniref:uncharacterized protein LOC143018014 n=1 Tax=Oratosquilla oratoria TaxID=337810 RepID=UPI003F765226
MTSRVRSGVLRKAKKNAKLTNPPVAVGGASASLSEQGLAEGGPVKKRGGGEGGDDAEQGIVHLEGDGSLSSVASSSRETGYSSSQEPGPGGSGDLAEVSGHIRVNPLCDPNVSSLSTSSTPPSAMSSSTTSSSTTSPSTTCLTRGRRAYRLTIPGAISSSSSSSLSKLRGLGRASSVSATSSSKLPSDIILDSVSNNEEGTKGSGINSVGEGGRGKRENGGGNNGDPKTCQNPYISGDKDEVTGGSGRGEEERGGGGGGGNSGQGGRSQDHAAVEGQHEAGTCGHGGEGEGPNNNTIRQGGSNGGGGRGAETGGGGGGGDEGGSRLGGESRASHSGAVGGDSTRIAQAVVEGPLSQGSTTSSPPPLQHHYHHHQPQPSPSPSPFPSSSSFTSSVKLREAKKSIRVEIVDSENMDLDSGGSLERRTVVVDR